MKKTLYICHAAIIAALYVVLTYVASLLNLSSGVIQVRLSEALCILPCFTTAAIPGLTIGCLLANLLTGCVTLDVVFGSIATLIGAAGTYLLRKNKLLMLVPPIISNAVIVPFVLKFAYGAEDAYWFMFATVGAGEVISAGILGFLLYMGLKKAKVFNEYQF